MHKMATTLEVAEGLQYQSSKEQLVWGITTTNWGSSPSSVSIVIYDETTDTDVTSVCLATTSASVGGDVITLPIIKNLSKGKNYRVEVQFTASSNIFNCYFRLGCLV